MEEQLISLKTAELAKQKGFNEECNTYITEDNTHWVVNGSFFKNEYGYLTAPTQSLLQKWLRDKYNIHITIRKVVGNRGTSIETISYTYKNTPWEAFKTYEDALEEALKTYLNTL